jgi:hypothetical protein
MPDRTKNAPGWDVLQEKKTPCLTSARGVDDSHEGIVLVPTPFTSKVVENRRMRVFWLTWQIADCQFAVCASSGIQLRDSAGLEPAFPVGSANVHIQFAAKVSTEKATCQMSKIINGRRFVAFGKL